MKSQTSQFTNRDARLKRWRYLPLEFVDKLPHNFSAIILAAVHDDGCNCLVRDRERAIRNQAKHRLPENIAGLLTLSAVVIGALSLSLVPYTLARESGRSNALATSIGFVGGGAAAFFAHSAAASYLTQCKLKAQTEQARQTIADN